MRAARVSRGPRRSSQYRRCRGCRTGSAAARLSQLRSTPGSQPLSRLARAHLVSPRARSPALLQAPRAARRPLVAARAAAASGTAPQRELRAHMANGAASRTAFAQERSLLTTMDEGLRATANAEVPA